MKKFVCDLCDSKLDGVSVITFDYDLLNTEINTENIISYRICKKCGVKFYNMIYDLMGKIVTEDME